MPTKHITTDADSGEEIIYTVNGVPTSTHVILSGRPHLPAVPPRPGVFHTELAAAVLELLRDRQYRANWDQATWRSVGFLMDALPEEMKQRYAGHVERGYVPSNVLRPDDMLELSMQTDTEASDARCGTAMCFAGWTGELTDVDWVIDAKTWRWAVKNATVPGDLEGALFLRKDSDMGRYLVGKIGAALDTCPPRVVAKNTADDLAERFYGDNVTNPMVEYSASGWRWLHSHATAGLRKRFTDRGFSPGSHYVLAASAYAALALGLFDAKHLMANYVCPLIYRGETPNIDPLSLFGAHNSLAQIARCIELYHHNGPFPPAAVVQSYHHTRDEFEGVEDYEPDLSGEPATSPGRLADALPGQS